MPTPNDDNPSNGYGDDAPQAAGVPRKRVLKQGAIPHARFVAALYDQLKRESLTLFEQAEGDSRRTGGDLDALMENLCRAIRDQSTEMRISAVRMLGRFGVSARAYSGNVRAAGDMAVTALTKALADADAVVREQATLALAHFAEMATPDLVNRVSRTTEDTDPSVRRAGVRTLRAFGPVMPLPVVEAFLHVISGPGAQDDELMRRAVEGLHDCGQNAASAAVETLTAIIRDSRLSDGVRILACRVLGWLGPEARSAGPALADVLVGVAGDSLDSEVRVEAAKALIGAADLPDLVTARVSGDDKRREIVSILRQVGPDAAVARRALETAWREEQASAVSTTDAPAGAVADSSAGATPDQFAELTSGIAKLHKLVESRKVGSVEKDWYTVAEVAELVKRAIWTIRNACREGRIKAEKGPDGQWRIPRDELVNIQNRGLSAKRDAE
jgi:hypothetical protein